MPEGRPPKREEVARILDYLPYGKSHDSRSYQKQPLVQADTHRQRPCHSVAPHCLQTAG